MSDPTREEYTPDTATVRATYATVATYRQSPAPDRVAAFTRWLESERRAARAEGWDEGYSLGYSVGYAVKSDFTSTLSYTNPYRQGADR